MTLVKRGNVWWYRFIYAGKLYQVSTKTTSKTIAAAAEKKRHRDLEEGINGLDTTKRQDRLKIVTEIAAKYLKDFQLRNPNSATFANYALGHVTDHLGDMQAIDVGPAVVVEYQNTRLREGAAPKTINDEVGVLLRILGERGDLIRLQLKREKKLNLKVPPTVGKKFNVEEKDSLTEQAKQSRSVHIRFALALNSNAGMRDAEIKEMQWWQFDFTSPIPVLTVGKSKTAAGEGRTIPLNGELLEAFLAHREWYLKKFKELNPTWFVFPFGRPGHMDPTRSVTTLKSAWQNLRARAGVEGRWHDNRHTLITELAEAGAGKMTIKGIAGHVSDRMMERYSHISVEAKRKALEKVLTLREEARVASREAIEKEAQREANATVN